MLFKTRPFEERMLYAPSGVPEGGRLYGLAGWMGAAGGSLCGGQTGTTRRKEGGGQSGKQEDNRGVLHFNSLDIAPHNRGA